MVGLFPVSLFRSASIRSQPGHAPLLCEFFEFEILVQLNGWLMLMMIIIVPVWCQRWKFFRPFHSPTSSCHLEWLIWHARENEIFYSILSCPWVALSTRSSTNSFHEGIRIERNNFELLSLKLKLEKKNVTYFEKLHGRQFLTDLYCFSMPLA